jgi:hypothetical protein
MMQKIADLSVKWIQETFTGVDELTDEVVNFYVDYRNEVMPWSEVTIEAFNQNRRLPKSYKRI